jgi:hypothetical protein
LVEATPISGPAWVGSNRSASRAMLLVGTFTTDGDRSAPAPWHVAQRGEGVRRLARLADEQRQPTFLQHRIAITELARDIDVDRQRARTCSNQYFATSPA